MRHASLLLLFLCLSAAAQAQDPAVGDIPFNGLIVDAAGKGLKARVTVKHSGKFTIADKAGRFGLTNLEADDTLVFRYRRNEITVPVAGRNSLKVVWIEDRLPESFEEASLVDDGFGYVKRREYTSSSSGVTGEMMVRRGYSDLQTAILAMFPSIQLINGEMVIRGPGSINLSNAALIVCDGTPVSNLRSINIHDVKSVEVQKGANMYGLRGGNGVIVIRTRKQ